MSADTSEYRVDVESNGASYQVGSPNNPYWLNDLGSKIQIQIQVKTGEKSVEVYNSSYLGEEGRSSPSIERILDRANVIGSAGGFHHPDSNDCYGAEVRVKSSAFIDYKIVPFREERKDWSDNRTSVEFTEEDLKHHAAILGDQWCEVKSKRAEEEKEEIARKSQRWK